MNRPLDLPCWELNLELESSSVIMPLASMSRFFVRFVNEFKAVAWVCSHVVLKRSEVALMKTLTPIPSASKTCTKYIFDHKNVTRHLNCKTMYITIL